MSNKYTSKKGVFTFTAENFQLQLSRINRDRHSNIYASVNVLTVDGKAYVAMDSGNLSNARFRAGIASQTAARNSGNPLAVDNLLVDALIALESDPEIAPPIPLPNFTPLHEFVRNIPPPRPPIVEGVLDRGGLYAIAAKPKAGKTVLVLQLAVCVSIGAEWLGRRTFQGPVYLFQLEDSERTLEGRLRRMTAGDWPSNFYLHTEPFKLTSENFSWTVEACKDAALIISDPIIQASSVRDWTDASEVRNAYELWRLLARETNAAVVVAVHHRKMDGDHGDALAGSIQAQATVDGIMELFRDKNLGRNERRLTFIGRDWSDRQDEALSLDTDSMLWSSAGTYAEVNDMDQEGKLQAKAAIVLDALPSAPPGLTYKELSEKSEMSRDRVREALEALGDQVARQGTEHSRNNPLRFWRLDESGIDDTEPEEASQQSEF